MKHIIATLLFFAFMYFATAIAAKAQWGFDFRPPEWGGYGYHRHHTHWRHYGGGQCQELRQACMYKRELGEEGQGNCRRYRETCQ